MYALPAEDLVIYLRVPPAEAHRLVGEKAVRDYTKLRHDIHESDLAHLQATSDAVSYTHLDVYKRQVSAREDWWLSLSAGGESFRIAPRVQSRRAVYLRVPHSSVSEGCGF